MSGSPVYAGLFALLMALLQLLLLGLAVHFFLRARRLRADLEQLRQERAVIFGFVHDVGEVFSGAEEADVDLLLKRVLFYALRTTRAGAGALYLFEPGGRQLRARVVSGVFPPLEPEDDLGLDRADSKSQHIEELVKTRRVQRGRGLVGSVADLDAPTLIEDAERDPRVPRYAEDFLRIRSLLLIPMRFRRQVMGVLALVNRMDGLPFTQGDLNLSQALADQASVSVHFISLREALEAKKRLDRDLETACRIQETLLPKELPRIEELELAAFNDPALQIGGDYYDCLRLGDDHLGLAIADVSGKSIGGAIIMAVCRSILRAEAPRHLSPAKVLRRLNEILSPDVTEDMFVTMVYMVLNLRTRDLVVARAGHPPPLWWQANGGEVRVLNTPGCAIGLPGSPVSRTVREESFRLERGDVVVAYTDGITEALNAQGEEWGHPQLLELVRRHGSEGAHSVLSHVRRQVERFVGQRAQSDDMTLLAMRVMG